MKNLFTISFLIYSCSCLAQFQVGHRTITYLDPDRDNRTIECEIYYPSDTHGENVDVSNDVFPVIVFGHGFAMQVVAYPNFWNEFFPRGYIMVFPTTEGSFISPNHGEFAPHLQFLVSEMQTQGSGFGSPFYQRVSGQSALLGHSMGGGAAFLGASGFSNVSCVVGLAPAETDPSAISAASSITAPVLILSGSSDGVTPPEDHHIPIYDAAGSECKYFVSIENGSHCHFASNTVTCTLGEIIPGSLPAEAQREVTYSVLHPWLDYFLYNDCGAWEDFQTSLSSQSDLGIINAECTNDPPTIFDNNGTIESDPQINYQWYLNGNEISGADQQTYTYSQSGTYQVGVTNIGNCPVLSNEVVVQITDIAAPRIEIVQVSNEQLVINTTHTTDPLRFEWIDLAGKLILSGACSFSAGNRATIQKPSTRGLKLLRLSNSDMVKVWRLF